MTPELYSRFTEELQRRIEADPRVVGLVALGSMAARDYLPDRWSDHDFFVIVHPGQQESFRNDRSWLPDAERIVLHLRETEHGLKVLYADGHLLEFAVFDLEELHLAQINRYRVLVDKDGVTHHLEQIHAATLDQTRQSSPTDSHLLGQFLTNLLVGVGRYQRGERLSGTQFVKSLALRHLIILLARHLPSENKARLDNLDPFRRFEVAFPALGAEIDNILLRETPLAATAVLALAQRELAHHLPEFPTEAVETVLQHLET
jgi:hypothetical protein